MLDEVRSICNSCYQKYIIKPNQSENRKEYHIIEEEVMDICNDQKEFDIIQKDMKIEELANVNSTLLQNYQQLQEKYDKLSKKADNTKKLYERNKKRKSRESLELQEQLSEKELSSSIKNPFNRRIIKYVFTVNIIFLLCCYSEMY